MRQSYDRHGRPIRRVHEAKTIGRGIRVRRVGFVPPTRAETISELLNEIEAEAIQLTPPRLGASHVIAVALALAELRARLAAKRRDWEKIGVRMFALGVLAERMRAEIPSRRGGVERSMKHSISDDEKRQRIAEADAILASTPGKMATKWERLRNKLPIPRSTYYRWKRDLDR